MTPVAPGKPSDVNETESEKQQHQPYEKSLGFAPNVTTLAPEKPSDVNKTESKQHPQQQSPSAVEVQAKSASPAVSESPRNKLSAFFSKKPSASPKGVRILEEERMGSPSRQSTRSRRQTVVDLLAYLMPRHSSGGSMQRFLGIVKGRTGEAGPSGTARPGSPSVSPGRSGAAGRYKTPPGPLSPDTVKVSVREDKYVKNKELGAMRQKMKSPKRFDQEGLQDLLNSLPTMASSSSTIWHSFPPSPKEKPTAPGGRLQTALVLGVFCLLAVAVGVFLFYGVTPTEPVCRSDVCLAYSKLLQQMLNVSVKPCDDFYSYVCSKWDARHSYSFKESVYLRFIQRVSERNRRTAVPAHGQSASQKAAKFYQSCSATYTQGGDSELDAVKQLLLRVGVLWPRLSNDSNVLRICFAMSATLDWAPVILFSVHRPAVPMTVSPSVFFREVLDRRQAMLGGGGSDYKTYFGHMLRVFDQPEEPRGDVLTYDELIAMESHLVPALERAYAVVEGDFLENATLDEVIQLAGNTIPKSAWEVQFRENFEAAVYNGTASQRVTVDNVGFFTTFFDLLRSLGESHMAYYLGWTAVQGLSLLTKPEVIRYYYSSYGEAARDHVLLCVGLTHHYTGLTFYASYIRDEVTPEVIDDVALLVRNVHASFRKGYAASPAWKDFVDRSTQPPAANASSSPSGPPLSFAHDSREDALNELFEHYPDMNSTVLDNIEGAVAARRATTRDTRTARFFWNGTVRFHYFVAKPATAVSQRFELMPVALEPLFYSLDAPPAVKYGALGADIADAIAGLVFDDLREADNSTRTAVESQPLCLLDASVAGTRSAVPPPGWPHMTRLQLAERAMSLDAAFRAFLDVTDGGHQTRLDRHHPLSGKMMLFVFWCMVQCGASDGKHKCNDPLRLIRYFGEAFQCDVGTAMATVKDCV
ncbi:neprilysin-1-like isoform X2 [Dermacentor albipictus]